MVQDSMRKLTRLQPPLVVVLLVSLPPPAPQQGNHFELHILRQCQHLFQKLKGRWARTELQSNLLQIEGTPTGFGFFASQK
jgi:hypothetical protein